MKLETGNKDEEYYMGHFSLGEIVQESGLGGHKNISEKILTETPCNKKYFFCSCSCKGSREEKFDSNIAKKSSY